MENSTVVLTIYTGNQTSTTSNTNITMKTTSTGASMKAATITTNLPETTTLNKTITSESTDGQPDLKSSTILTKTTSKYQDTTKNEGKHLNASIMAQ